MRHINLKLFWSLLFLFLIIAFLSISFIVYYVESDKSVKIQKQEIFTKIDDLKYAVSLAIDRNGVASAIEILDSKVALNNDIESLSISHEGKIILSSNRNYLKKSIKDLKLIDEKGFKTSKILKLDSLIVLDLRTSHYFSDKNAYRLLYGLSKDYIDSYEDLPIRYLSNVVLFTIVIFFTIFITIKKFILDPIEIIKNKIVDKEYKYSDFTLNEMNLIDINVIDSLELSQYRHEQLKELSYQDELTKAYNRKAYNERLSEYLARFNRYETPFSLLMYDIDDFKQVNDYYGHIEGDKVLKVMTASIQDSLRENDYLFRIGGEEFMIIFAETKLDKAILIAEKIREKVASLEMISGEVVTISIGVVEVYKSDTSDGIFERVDELLYRSKKNGKNMVSY